MPLVLLDRDGVLNVDRPGSVRCINELRLIPGAGEAVRLLNDKGWRVVVITNQAIVGRGEISEKDLERIHQALKEKLKRFKASLSDIIVCTDAAPSPRRKPEPGMIDEILAKENQPASQVPFVGDALQDMQAAYAAGCPRILVRTGKGKVTAQSPHLSCLKPLLIFDTVLEAARSITRV